MFWHREPQKSWDCWESCHWCHAARDSVLAPLGSSRSQMCTPALPQNSPVSHAEKEDAWEGSVKCEFSWVKKKTKVRGFAQETVWGWGKETECRSLKCKVEIFLLGKRKKTPQGDDFFQRAGEQLVAKPTLGWSWETVWVRSSLVPLLQMESCCTILFGFVITDTAVFEYMRVENNLLRFNESRNDANRNPSTLIPACPKHI